MKKILLVLGLLVGCKPVNPYHYTTTGKVESIDLRKDSTSRKAQKSILADWGRPSNIKTLGDILAKQLEDLPPVAKYKINTNGDSLILIKKLRLQVIENMPVAEMPGQYDYQYVNKLEYEDNLPITLTRKQYKSILKRLSDLEKSH